jgi:hypothetical protein
MPSLCINTHIAGEILQRGMNIKIQCSFYARRWWFCKTNGQMSAGACIIHEDPPTANHNPQTGKRVTEMTGLFLAMEFNIL